MNRLQRLLFCHYLLANFLAIGYVAEFFRGLPMVWGLMAILATNLGLIRWARRDRERLEMCAPVKWNRVEGVWHNAPIAEVDKSTLGKLLAGRMRRDPGLHVIVQLGTAEPSPVSDHELYDRELDG